MLCFGVKYFIQCLTLFNFCCGKNEIKCFLFKSRVVVACDSNMHTPHHVVSTVMVRTNTVYTPSNVLLESLILPICDESNCILSKLFLVNQKKAGIKKDLIAKGNL